MSGSRQSGDSPLQVLKFAEPAVSPVSTAWAEQRARLSKVVTPPVYTAWAEQMQKAAKIMVPPISTGLTDQLAKASKLAAVPPISTGLTDQLAKASKLAAVAMPSISTTWAGQLAAVATKGVTAGMWSAFSEAACKADPGVRAIAEAVAQSVVEAEEPTAQWSQAERVVIQALVALILTAAIMQLGLNESAVAQVLALVLSSAGVGGLNSLKYTGKAFDWWRGR